MKLLPQSGQTLLLVLLSMAVVLTIVLSIITRSITDISITSTEEEALRAFSAAEAGVERALIIGSDTSGTLESASFDAKVTDLAYGAGTFEHPTTLNSGESVTFWFVEHDEDTGELTCSGGTCFTGVSATFCWGEEDSPSGEATTPAAEISIFYAEIPGDYSTVKIARSVIDPNSSRTASNNFSSPDIGGCTLEDKIYEFQKTITFSDLGIPFGSYSVANGLQFARLRLLYNTDRSHPVGLDATAPGNGLLPSQGLRIDSVGSFGDANRRVEVFQTFGELPPIFDQAIFSPGGIVK